VLAAATKLAAAIRRRDRAAADKLLALEFTFIDAAGRVHARKDVLKSLKPGPDSRGARPKVRSYGRIALVTGSGKSAQAKETSDLVSVDVWVKGDGGWKALVHHNNVQAKKTAPRAHPMPPGRPKEAKPPECRNPLAMVPYKPKSQAERDIIAAFQALETAVTRNDADEWVKHVADEFVVYRTRQHPTTKTDRVALIRSLALVNAETFVAEVKWMKLWVLGDAAVMRADHVMPGNRRPPYRATRVWVKRDSRWQMAASQQTTIVRR